jgi:hypothetical protein
MKSQIHLREHNRSREKPEPDPIGKNEVRDPPVAEWEGLYAGILQIPAGQANIYMEAGI